jgi:hypothetical protein
MTRALRGSVAGVADPRNLATISTAAPSRTVAPFPSNSLALVSHSRPDAVGGAAISAQARSGDAVGRHWRLA